MRDEPCPEAIESLPLPKDWTETVRHAVLNVVDHYSRRSMGFAVFKSEPSSEEVTSALDRIWLKESVRPKHLIVDQGPVFKCEHFEETWCEDRNILPRFGAVGKHASIAVVERFQVHPTEAYVVEGTTGNPLSRRVTKTHVFAGAGKI